MPTLHCLKIKACTSIINVRLFEFLLSPLFPSQKKGPARMRLLARGMLTIENHLSKTLSSGFFNGI